ncbi:hypothetical protein LTR95_011407 [Oleoguttula sp. CCFEE 5521]
MVLRSPPPPAHGSYVGGLAQMSGLRTPPSTPVIATHDSPEDLPDCPTIKIPSTSTSTFSAARPYRVPVAFAPASPQQPSIHDHKWIRRQPHHPSHRQLSPPPYPSKRIVDRLHIPAVLEREKERYQHLLFESSMKDGGGLIDIDGEKMLVEEIDREKVVELKRRQARAKLEGWEWDQRDEEKRAGMGHVKRPFGMGARAEDAVAGRCAPRDRTARHGASQQVPDSEMELNVLSGNVGLPLEGSATLAKASDTSRTGLHTPMKSRPHLRGGDASHIAHTRERLLDRTVAAEISHWSASTEAAGCVLATRAGIRSGISCTVRALRTKHQTSSSTKGISLRRRHGNYASSKRMSKAQARKSQDVVCATIAIPALPSRAFEDAISIVASSPGSTDVSIIQSREHHFRLDKPLPPLPGQGMASGERATSCVAVFDIVSPTILSADEEWPTSQRSTPRVRLRKCKGRSNLLMDGLVDGYLATWCIAHR